ncbi:hypothetical protein A2276_06290 [candidate division WOR-1 bacterium RIFOXYA12_FULL_43_27]|uniref:Uncharacterized protein n=1 Tax=candidate division WOR-1 bacterium RIFOXYC2_FULL_46_14 TaxID=1802587 RepID=A0A1F4U5F4_UNCSA|nr:MAG: hypothetical protein A2276_06290 [candidate division WOR-1 bacterium RIFOXYA12_FULL_43_27]OGC20262.1 MAG: hypothetical protein A2292_04290 [candidate division WOR-1 bacterium RIFOXYB2_FULL_46_45]OGC32001.1 MAG: hypothetical protein A2232_07160 [candidate division WOR-1 bacterium RIFOXYA2_FULL_46_56]OGC40109.1 MAG: hypothetical protein A2438_02310 [candidate division WOR-1 bacterium RIFOXYC2_FULL_46_14]
MVYTNGTEFPTELSSAVRYLDEYPNNATFCLSLDRHHREALAQNGFDLKIIFRTLYEACGLSGKRLEFNARVEPEKTGMPLNGLEDIFSSEHQKTSWKAMAFANSVLAQGWAINLPENETKLLSLADFLLHLKKIHPMGLWATSTGLVASSGHAAHLASPPPFAVYGDLNKTTLAKILWESLGGYFVTSGKAKGLSFEEAMVQHAKNFVLVPTDTEKFMKILCDKTETREPPAEEVAAFLANPKVPITWEVDVDDPLPYLSGFSFDPKMLGPNIIPVIKKGRLEFLSKEATKAAEIIPFRPRGLEFQLSDGSRIVFGPIHERSLL